VWEWEEEEEEGNNDRLELFLFFVGRTSKAMRFSMMQLT
jgi:hypothetical protein